MKWHRRTEKRRGFLIELGNMETNIGTIKISVSLKGELVAEPPNCDSLYIPAKELLEGINEALPETHIEDLERSK